MMPAHTEQPMKYRVAWQTANGHTGHSEPLDRASAEVTAEWANAKDAGVFHWIEPAAELPIQPVSDAGFV